MTENKRVDFVTPEEFLSRETDFYSLLLSKVKADMHCASPAIIKSFDSSKQTITAQIAIKERIFSRGVYEHFKNGIIPDVPIFMPRSGKFVITTPIAVGDECLLIFCDTCIDAWFESGGEENVQKFQRRHNINDCFALCGIWSQPNVVSDYSEDSLQIRTLDGNVCIDVTETGVSIKASSKVSIECAEAEIKSSGVVNVEGSQVNLGESNDTRKIIDERLIDLFNNHTHNYNPGPGSSTPSGSPNTALTLLTCATIKTGAK